MSAFQGPRDQQRLRAQPRARAPCGRLSSVPASGRLHVNTGATDMHADPGPTWVRYVLSEARFLSL